MYRTLIIMLLLSLTTNVRSQVPRWIIHPQYDDVKIIGNGCFIVSKDGKFGMLDSSEKEIIPLEYDSISPFKNHYALLFKAGMFVAYTNEDGVVKDVSHDNFVLEKRNASFHDDHLLVRNNSGYYFINGINHSIIGPYSGAFPFSEGFAKVLVPKSKKHIFDGTSFSKYLSKQDEIRELPIEGASDEEKNYIVDFISTISNGKSIVIIKKRVYEYHVSTNRLIPLSSDGSSNKKSKILAKERPSKIYGDEMGGYTIEIQQGRIELDPYMRLLKIRHNGNELRTNTILEEEKKITESLFRALSYNNTSLLGLSYNSKEFLPAQFDKVKALQGDYAVVMMKGKCGVVGLHENAKCQYVLNDNTEVGFEHKTLKTTIKVVCPPEMNPALMSLASEDDNCQINTETRTENRNVESSTLSYECVLSIPEKIDLDLTPSSISVAMNYDGLKFVSGTLGFNTWYINNYTVDAIRHPVVNSILNVDVIVKNNSSDNRNYFKNVTVETEDSVISTINKVTEELYSVKIYGWKDGIVRFDINVNEDGCPVITYPFRFNLKNSSEAKQEKEEKPIVVSKPRIRTQTKKREIKEPKKVYIPN